MKHAATLIEKFFRGECDEHEKQLVKAYFTRHPEALQPYLTEESWHSFYTDQSLPTVISDKMLAVIESRTYQKKKVRYRYYKLAAAVILPVAIAGLLWITQQQQPVKQVAVVAPVVQPVVIPVVYQYKTNSTGKTMPLHLNDGSVVELAPRSQIKYQEPFGKNKRDIYLKGQALFKVAHDEENPFTVYAGNLGTTALGTVFKVTAWENKGVVRVQLLSGKVVVRPDSTLERKGVKETYLLPGQDLYFDQVKMAVAITLINKTDKRSNKQIPVKPEKEVFSFNNEPVANIFRLMADKYQVKIQCQADILTDMSFTGTFDSSKESLIDFLSTIGILNNLIIKQTDDVIYVTQ
ncbi:FecR domain-containing protein [Chitinophaga sp. MM2321]|uniref:FecR family protein n=1 Tax=Chitinophaga sp. MM2321 TaxID=3137178 RepID=UPI0032D5AAB0